jgi:hypothetical protein
MFAPPFTLYRWTCNKDYLDYYHNLSKVATKLQVLHFST